MRCRGHLPNFMPGMPGRPSRLADVAGFWPLDRTTITGRSAVILRQHTTPFRPMIVPFDDLELVYQSLRTLEPPHTRKFPRVNAQDSRLGPIQPWDVKDFLGRTAGKDSGRQQGGICGLSGGSLLISGAGRRLIRWSHSDRRPRILLPNRRIE